MVDRRRFLARSIVLTAAAMPAVIHAQKVPSSSDSDPELLSSMRTRLARELDDPALAATLAPSILNVGFEWTSPMRPAADLRAVIAYSFGNRLAADPKAQPEPGPVNEVLADTVVRVHKLLPSGSRIYAQWEIAHFLTAKYGFKDVVSIEPVIAADGTVTYLSTDGVAEAAVKRAGGTAAIGPVAVVGHRDHAKRCVLTSRGRGMDAWVAKEVSLPVEYDAESGQPWTRRRDLYLLHDMAAQMMMLRAAKIAEAYPKG
ncbi:hypothetical protein ESZ00_12595 [Silvibacterium dinghuense]|uniref:Lipoprotein n=2 Tax=Silvibacterium dinghuense TaxID=1560006 RepID=A0A4Q1SEP1_9BACT|nr:hypothetical protein ESZ00_12595 [Silvibacterium dinghuense]